MLKHQLCEFFPFRSCVPLQTKKYQNKTINQQFVLPVSYSAVRGGAKKANSHSLMLLT